MRNVSDKICRENQKTHFVFSKFFPPKNRAVYEIIWKNVVETERQATDDNTRVAYAHCMLDK
jgi:hypothetical protein